MLQQQLLICLPPVRKFPKLRAVRSGVALHLEKRLLYDLLENRLEAEVSELLQKPGQ